jgi:hypothetical protein
MEYFWIDADFLARCIAAVLRGDPFTSQQGTNDIRWKVAQSVMTARRTRRLCVARPVDSGFGKKRSHGRLTQFGTSAST